jgi:hypothetical protein
METVTITIPSKLAVYARSLAEMRRQNLSDFILSELQRILSKKNGGRLRQERKR